MQKIILVMWNQDGSEADADAFANIEALRKYLVDELCNDEQIVHEFIEGKDSYSEELRIEDVYWDYTINK